MPADGRWVLIRRLKGQLIWKNFESEFKRGGIIKILEILKKLLANLVCA
jgi:hypothetical protein